MPYPLRNVENQVRCTLNSMAQQGQEHYITICSVCSIVLSLRISVTRRHVSMCSDCDVMYCHWGFLPWGSTSPCVPIVMLCIVMKDFCHEEARLHVFWTCMVMKLWPEKTQVFYKISLYAFAGICCEDHTSVIHIIHRIRVLQKCHKEFAFACVQSLIEKPVTATVWFSSNSHNNKYALWFIQMVKCSAIGEFSYPNNIQC